MIASEPKQYGSEAGHWYAKDGTPMHQVPYKDKKRAGELRDTTLTDARERGLLPSVSGILGILGKPGLDNWKKRQVAEAAYEFGDAICGDFETIIGEILSKAEENMSRARDLGTEIHGAINRYLTNYLHGFDFLQEPGHPDFQLAHSECVVAARNALKELGVWGNAFESEKTFGSVLGYGGTIDFKTDGLIADFKCVDRLDKKLDYPDRVSQLTAYSMGSIPDDIPYLVQDVMWVGTRLVNVFISTSEPGKYLIREYTQEEKDQGHKLFCACFALWKVVNKYDPVLNESKLHEVSFSKIV